MAQVLAIFVMLAILSVIIIVHEIGHFSVARLFGFQTPVFGFGLPFGPHWVVGQKWGTEFRIHACLLGGYVAIPELGDESGASQDAFGVPLKPFRKFPIWQRALVAFAGVGFNILFAYFVMLYMFLTLGQPTQPTVVYDLIRSNPIAMNAGIKSGDKLLTIDGLKVTSPEEAVHILLARKTQKVTIVVDRKGANTSFDMVTNADGKVGMKLTSEGAVTYEKMDGGFFNIAGAAFNKLCTLTVSMIEAMGQMLSGIASGGAGGGGPGADHKTQFSLSDLHGVLAVIKIGADIAQQDWSQLFIFTIMISMDLAIINLVPWPALDGGHLAFMLFEGVRGKPMDERAQGEIVKWGFISLLVLMAVVMVNDVTALVSGKLDLKKKSSSSQVEKSKEQDVADNDKDATDKAGTAQTSASEEKTSTEASK